MPRPCIAGPSNRSPARRPSRAARYVCADLSYGPGPAPSERFDDPDIRVRSLRGNAVLRWEYLPGSTLYLVWTQRRSASEGPKNIFLLKATYWWNP